MSIESWKEEFYPVPAQDVEESDALDHSIQKWTGLLKKNLKKHKVEQSPDNGKEILDEGGRTFSVDDGSCALCVHYYDPSDSFTRRCTFCPLRQYLGRPCDVFGRRTSMGSPYMRFKLWGRAQPMLTALRRAKRRLEK